METVLAWSFLKVSISLAFLSVQYPSIKITHHAKMKKNRNINRKKKRLILYPHASGEWDVCEDYGNSNKINMNQPSAIWEKVTYY